jgi:hypothetical protein
MRAIPITFAIVAVLLALLVGWIATTFGPQAFGVVLVLWLAWRGRRHVRRAARREDGLQRLYAEAVREAERGES